MLVFFLYEAHPSSSCLYLGVPGASLSHPALVKIDFKNVSAHISQQCLICMLVDLDNRTYEQAGKMLEYGIVHHGCKPRFFSEKFYSMLTTAYTETCLEVSDVSDPALRRYLEKVTFVYFDRTLT